ncbi:MAG: hypothetical protein JXB32_09565 [Deltaproteobacteria bacterium]|nr:hypothetical protein [Deltaproteobacteria bacterium]
MGKPAYVAPEHFLSQALDERADLYACGIVLFRMLAGRLPYKSTNAQMLWVERWAERETPNELASVRAFVPDVPEPVAVVVARALRKNPGQRYRTAREMQGELLQAERSLGAAAVTLRSSGAVTGRVPTAGWPPGPPVPTPGAVSAVAAAPAAVEAHSSTVVGRSSAAFTQPAGSRRSLALAVALVVFAALAVVLAVRFAFRRDAEPAPPVPAAAAVPVLSSADAGLPAVPPPEPGERADAAASADEVGEPGAGAVKVAAPEPDAGPVPPPDVAPAEPAVEPVAVPARDVGTARPPRVETVRLSFAGVPAGASVSVGGRAVDPARGIELPRETEPVLVVVNVPGGRYERWSDTVVPDRDRTVRPDLRFRPSGSSADATQVVAVPRPVDAGAARPPADARTASSDAGVRDGRLGTTFITTWGD